MNIATAQLPMHSFTWKDRQVHVVMNGWTNGWMDEWITESKNGTPPWYQISHEL